MTLTPEQRVTFLRLEREYRYRMYEDGDPLTYPARWRHKVYSVARRRLKRLRETQRFIQTGEVPAQRRLRALILIRDGGICQCCECELDLDPGYWLGHLQDKVHDGPMTPENLVALCAGCNFFMPPCRTIDEGWEAINWRRSRMGLRRREATRRG